MHSSQAVRVNGFWLRFQTGREQAAVHVQAHGGSMGVISIEHTVVRENAPFVVALPVGVSEISLTIRVECGRK